MEEMKRLTKFVDGRWIENHDFDERNGWKNGNLACMDKLAAYENTGFEPDEIPTGYELANVFASMQLLQRFLEIGTPEQFQKLMDAQKNELLTVEELRQIQNDNSFEWVYIECLKQFESACKKSAYYRVQVNFSGVEVFCCGYPGILFGFDYADYGKTWLAYRRKPEGETE